MSDQYAKKVTAEPIAATTNEMRQWCQRPGRKGPDGKPLYTTEQHHKDTCDVNMIIQKHDKTGIITHISKIEAKYGDVSGIDFKSMQDRVAGARTMFNELPSNLRKRFKNNPSELIRFMDNPNNRDEAIQLGLIDSRWTPETDGIGEHVKEGENVIKAADNPPQT